MWFRTSTFVAIFTAWMFSSRSEGQCETAALINPNYNYFAFGVDISGTRLVVGSLGSVASVFELGYGPPGTMGQWVLTQELLPSSGFPGPYGFAGAVAHDGDDIVVSEQGFQNIGAVHVYRLDGTRWAEVQVLTASDATDGANFGRCVGISNDVMLVGAPGAMNGDESTGAAYLFYFDGLTWQEGAKLLASDGSAADSFGAAVAFGRDVVLVGAPRHDGVGMDSGAAYVYHHVGTEWVEQKLTASDESAIAYFGGAVAMDGSVAVIGATGDDDNGSEAGAAYVFRFDGATWIEETKLLPSDGGGAGNVFGYGVAIEGEFVICTAPNDNNGDLNEAGSAYTFSFDGQDWVEGLKLVPSDPQLGGTFGLFIVISGDKTVLNSPSNEHPYGKVYVFAGLTATDSNQNGVRDGCEPDCNANGIPDTSDIASGASIDSNGNGFPDECECLQEGGECDDGEPCNGQEVCDEVCVTLPFPDCNSNGIVDSCEIPGSGDCNGNGVPDDCDPDNDNDGTPDDCECPADVDGDNIVDVSDFLLVLAQWGPCPPVCIADVDGDGTVDVRDFLDVLGQWGPCQ